MLTFKHDASSPVGSKWCWDTAAGHCEGSAYSL